MKKNWYKSALRRNVVDMHIPDWDKSFLSKFDATAYVDLLKQSKSQSAVIYAHSHAGLALYPTKVGYPHKALKGRNFVKEVFDQCEKADIARVLYFSLIYDGAAYDAHPDWRIVSRFNREYAFDKTERRSRYGVCCPNSEGYRQYIRDYIQEICSEFDFEGIRFDMTFWPELCFCTNCRAKYFNETGKNIPYIVDWQSPDWVLFQRKREQWLVDFGKLATETVRSCNPNVTVEHQSSTYIGNWIMGVTADLRDAGDFLQGDFYGDHFQGSIARKLFSTLSLNQPFGFETSFNVSLRDHTAKKDAALLKCKVSACMADAGAFVFIDAIDPVGTMNPAPYKIMDEVFAFSQPFEKFIGGKRMCDVAVYLATESKFPYDNPPTTIVKGDLNLSSPHFAAITNACTALIEHNIPYTIVTKMNLDSLSEYKVVVLCDVFALSTEECEGLRRYVKNGGALYASHYASLMGTHGNVRDNFMLADVFGADYMGKTEENFTYISPTDDNLRLFCGANQKYPIGISHNQTIIRSGETAEILGTTTLPYTNPASGYFASIHSDPPGKYTQNAAIIRNGYGSGVCIYTAGPLEANATQKQVFVKMIESLIGDKLIDSNAPKSVEITLHKQNSNHCYILSLVNFQFQTPCVPVYDTKVSIAITENVTGVSLLPDEQTMSFTKQNGRVYFTVPCVETLAMLKIQYEEGDQ